MQVSPYLSFDGQCEAAFKFYESCLGGRIGAMLSYAETPMAQHMPPEARGRIAHARLMLGDQLLMGSDAPPGRYEASKGMSVTLGIVGVDEAERVFQALAEGGTVGMPLQKTFWALRFGMLVDRFGTPFMINCEK